MNGVTSFSSLNQVMHHWEEVTKEANQGSQDLLPFFQGLIEYKTAINSFAKEYEFAPCYLSLEQLQEKKRLLSELKDKLQNLSLTNEQLRLYFKSLPSEVRNEFYLFASAYGIPSFENNFRALLRFKKPNDQDYFIDLQINWVKEQITAYNMRAFVFQKLHEIKPKLNALIENTRHRMTPPPQVSVFADRDFDEMWWEIQAEYDNFFRVMVQKLQKKEFSGKLTQYGSFKNENLVKIGPEKKEINAHYTFEGRYIQTACPRLHSVNDFWRMIVETRAQTIVMVNELYETPFFVQYWPTPLESSLEFDSIKISVISHINIFPERPSSNVINQGFLPYISKTTLLVTAPGIEPFQVVHLHQRNWHDGRGADPVSVNILTEEILQNQSNKQTPAVIHCGAGFGRTGTMTTILKVSSDIREGKKDAMKIKDAVAYQRDVSTGRGGGMVNAEQYFSCFATIQHRLQVSL